MSLTSAVSNATKSAMRGRVKAQASRAVALGDEVLKATRSTFGQDALVVSKAAKQATRKTVKAGNGAFQQSTIDLNRELGAAREALAFKRLRREFPKAEGYVIVPQPYLRDAEGNILKDSLTDEARRIDFVVLRKKSVVQSFEVTSMTAPKLEQIAKETRIRLDGGNYVLNPETQQLAYFPKRLETKVWRFE